MDPAVLSILGVGVALAAIILNGQRTMRAEFRAEFSAVRVEINVVRAEVNALRSDLHALGERVARIEGLLAGPPRFLEPPPPTDGERAA